MADYSIAPIETHDQKKAHEQNWPFIIILLKYKDFIYLVIYLWGRGRERGKNRIPSRP